MKKTFLSLLALCFAALLAYSGYRAWNAYGDYRKEAAMHDTVMVFKPEGDRVNQKIADLRARYPDAVGWLTVPGTKIDYPFVRYKDNDHYLRRDLNGEYAVAGTLFMDCRNKTDFSSPITIIYGHHMKNGSMFGTLKLFEDKTFFNENPYAYIYLPHETLTLEIFAYMVINPSTDREIYNISLNDSYMDYVRANARCFREVELASGDRVVTLSTCAYDFRNARMVLLAKVV